jgi:hypothetical protein
MFLLVAASSASAVPALGEGDDRSTNVGKLAGNPTPQAPASADDNGLARQFTHDRLRVHWCTGPLTDVEVCPRDGV